MVFFQLTNIYLILSLLQSMSPRLELIMVEHKWIRQMRIGLSTLTMTMKITTY